MNVGKFALAGTVVGVGAGMLGDAINVNVLNPILLPGPATQPSKVGMAGRMAFQIVAGSVVAGAAMYAGDRLIDVMLSGEDPLFRSFYVLSTFSSMRLVHQNMNNVTGLVDLLVGAVKNNVAPLPPSRPSTTARGPTPTMMARQAEKKPCCS